MAARIQVAFCFQLVWCETTCNNGLLGSSTTENSRCQGEGEASAALMHIIFSYQHAELPHPPHLY